MLELRTPLAIRRDCRPVVVPSLVTRDTEIDHGFNRKYMAHFHGALGFVLGIMRDIGDGVEQTANAVATIRPDDTAAILLGHLLNGRAQIAIERTRLDHVHGGSQTFKGCLHHSTAILVNITDTKGLIQVTVKAPLVVGCHVQIHNI